MSRPATVRFYFDADILGVAKLLATVRPDISHTREIAAVRLYGARMVALAGTDAKTTWAQLEIVMCQWRRIEQCLEEDGPFIYTATRSRLQAVPL